MALFDEQRSTSHQAVASVTPTGSITYDELGARADRAAAWLRTRTSHQDASACGYVNRRDTRRIAQPRLAPRNSIDPALPDSRRK